MNKRMDEQMYKWMDNKWVGEWTDKWMDGRRDEQMNRLANVPMDGQWTNRWTNGQKNRRMDELTVSFWVHFILSKLLKICFITVCLFVCLFVNCRMTTWTVMVTLKLREK